MKTQQKLPDYLNDLYLAFKQARKKLKKDGVLYINIADTHKFNYKFFKAA